MSNVTLANKVKHTKWYNQLQVSTKTQKVSACCQGHTGNGPHPCGVGVGVPDDGLARPKSNYLSNVTLANRVKHTKLHNQSQVSTKTQKVSACCQGHTGNGPHPCGVGVGVPDDGLARPKSNYLSNVTLANRVKHTKLFKQSQVSTKTQKVSACCLGHTGNGPHPRGVGVGVPDDGLACPKSNYLSNVTLVNQVKHTKQYKQSQVSTKTQKVSACCQGHTGNGPHPRGVGVGVPDDGLARPKLNYLSNVTMENKVKSAKYTQENIVKVSRSLSLITAQSRSRSQPGHSPVMGLSSSGHSPVTALVTLSISNVTTVSHLSQASTVQQVTHSHSISRKRRNKLIKQKNGNGKNSLVISHWNLGSKKWSNKQNQIQALVDQCKPDLLFISEANLDEMTPLHESLISGYNITKPKTITRNGTSRLILLSIENLDFELREDLMDDIFSSIWIKITRQETKEHQYLNQDNDWSLQPLEQNKRWSNFFRQVETARISETCHIIGDVNLDYQKWDLPDFAHLQMITETKDTLEAGGFFQLIKEVTRSWPGQSDSLIDHFWTNNPQKIIQVSNMVRAVGDHNVISATIRLKGSDTRRLDTRRRSYKTFDPVIYRQKLNMIDWSQIYSISDVNLANDFLETNVAEILDELCPYKTIQYRKECKSWLSSETKDKMLDRDKMREIARITKNPDSWKLYRSLRNEVNRKVNSDRKSHYDDLYKLHLKNNDVGGTYRTAKNQVGMTKNTSPTSYLHEGSKITDPQKMADLQMQTFTDKTKKLISELPPPTIDPCQSLSDSLHSWGNKKDLRENFNFKSISNIDTLKIIKDLSNSTSSANDRIDSISLKHGAETLHVPLTHVINCSIKSSTFATRWKIGKLLPLHKGKGLNPQDPKSFRPISLLPVIGKVVERALQTQILDFMEKSGQFNPNHHSYRKHHSTTTAMLQLSDAIFSGCDAKNITTLITLDQSAAFDVLSHDTLLRKLKLYNFSDTALTWIKSYLNFRSQYVTVGTRNSKFHNVTNGVPQGSVLGPIFYVLYVNELPNLLNDNDCNDSVHSKDDIDANLFSDNCLKCGQLPTYADDSTVVITTPNRYQAQERISVIIDRVKQFLAANSLSLNIGKTEIVEIMVRQKRVKLTGLPPQLTVIKPDGILKVITAKEHCRLLGANINRDGTWCHQLELGEKPLLKSLRSTLGVLTHISRNLPIKSRLILANGLFISKLLYLLPMWGGLMNRDCRKIQRLLNKCARMVLGRNRKTRTRKLMQECNWLYFTELVSYHSVIQLYKIINSNKPVNLCNKFSITPESRILITPGRLNIARNSFKWRSVHTWNELPSHVIECTKLSGFKKALRRHIIEDRAEITPRRPPELD